MHNHLVSLFPSCQVALRSFMTSYSTQDSEDSVYELLSASERIINVNLIHLIPGFRFLRLAKFARRVDPKSTRETSLCTKAFEEKQEKTAE